MRHCVYLYYSSTITTSDFYLFSSAFWLTSAAPENEAFLDDYGGEEDAGLYNSASDCRLWTSSTPETLKYWAGFSMSCIVKLTTLDLCICTHCFSWYVIQTNRKQSDNNCLLKCWRDILKTFVIALLALSPPRLSTRRTNLEQEMRILSQELQLWCGFYS